MKRLVLSVFIMCLYISLYGQEIEVSGNYAHSSFKSFANCFGYQIGYNHYIKSKNRVGVAFTQIYNSTPYDDVQLSSGTGRYDFITHVLPSNKRNDVSVHFSFRLINELKSKLYFGTKIGFTNYTINEYTERILSDGSTTDYRSSSKTKGKLTLGALLDFELNEIVSKNISVFILINPEVSAYGKLNMDGGNDPDLITGLNFKLGLRYSFVQKN